MSEEGETRQPESVVLRHLSFRSFRNYESLDLDLDGGLTLVVGPNGQGKTNLIEGIYFLCLGRSFRERREKRIIRLGDERAVLSGEFEARDDRLRVVFRLGRDGSKAASLDGTGLDRLRDLVGRFPVIGLTPDDSNIVVGDPSSRRRFMDLILAQTGRPYLEALREYRAALARRNRCLREGRRSLAAAYDEGLTIQATEIRKKRAGLVGFMLNRARDYYRDVSRQEEAFDIEYRPSPAGDPGDEALVAETLDRTLAADEERGYTGVGPHRDELVLRVQDRELRTFGSHGQIRTALAALKLSEVEYFTAVYGRSPLLVMDEVASVLDAERALNLVEIVTDTTNQVLITSPGRDIPETLAGRAARIVTVSRGVVEPVPERNCERSRGSER